MRRGAPGLEPASWKEALRDIGARVRAIRRSHGPDSIAMYVGTAAGFSVLHPIFAQGFMTGLGSKSMYASATRDCANKFAVARHVYGFPFIQPFPDMRDNEGDGGWGLQSEGFELVYDDCMNGGMLHREQGLIYVR